MSADQECPECLHPKEIHGNSGCLLVDALGFAKCGCRETFRESSGEK